MLDSKLCLIVVLRGNIDTPFPMDLIHFVKHGGICALKINKRVKTQFCSRQKNFRKYKKDKYLGEVALLIN